MKIVIFDKETDLIRDTILHAKEVEFDGENLSWHNGSLMGIKDTTQVVVLDDSEEVPAIFDGLEGGLENESDDQVKVSVHKVTKDMLKKDKKNEFKKEKVNDVKGEIEKLKAEVKALKEKDTNQ